MLVHVLDAGAALQQVVFAGVTVVPVVPVFVPPELGATTIVPPDVSVGGSSTGGGSTGGGSTGTVPDPLLPDPFPCCPLPIGSFPDPASFPVPF